MKLPKHKDTGPKCLQCVTGITLKESSETNGYCYICDSYHQKPKPSVWDENAPHEDGYVRKETV